jgi:hypothetical protein
VLNDVPAHSNKEVDHAKTSLLLSRNANSFACYSRLVSMPRQIVLSGTLESSATLLKSPSTSMDFLNLTDASALLGQAAC